MSATPGGPAPVAPNEKPPRGLRFRFRSAGGSTRVADAAFRLLCQAASLLVIVLAALLVSVLIWRAWLAIETTGLSFFTTSKWDPEPTHRKFGALAFVYGTVVTSVLAMLVAVPFGVGTATFLSELAPAWLRRAGSFFVEMLAAIPSVVYGFWGIFFLVPVLQVVYLRLAIPNTSGLTPEVFKGARARATPASFIAVMAGVPQGITGTDFEIM